MSFTPYRVIAALAFGAVLAGSFLPWAHVGSINLDGYDRHGGITAAISLVALYLLVTCETRIPLLIAFAGAIAIACIGLYDAAQPEQLRWAIQAKEMGILTPPTRLGIGLYIVVAGSLAAVAASWGLAVNTSDRGALLSPVARGLRTR